MNRKLFFGLLVSACMLFATSCKKDELDESLYGGEAKVTFSLGLEGENVATKSISDGSQADKLIYAVFDENGTRISSIAAVQVTDVTFPKEVTLTLAKGQTYQVAFWAQDNDCQAYTVDTVTMNVAVSYDDALNNDETRDAFFAAETFTVDGDQEIGVTMRRPFAQINVGATVADWNAAVASGVEISTSKVVINNAATSINLLTGAVADPVEVVYDFATIPAQFDPVENLMVDTDGDGTPEIYKWLSMSYILVADESDGASMATLQSLQYTFTPVNGNPIELEAGLNTVPVQRNWRTNILGKILTGDIQFNITIDPNYDDDYIFLNGDNPIQDLEFAASFGGTFTLFEDVTMPEDRPSLEVAADFTLNLNEYTFTSGNVSHYGIIVNSGTTTINGGGNIMSNGGGIGIVNGANVIFNGGNLYLNTASTSGRYLFYLEGEGSTATINGGNFDFSRTLNQKRAYIYANEGTTVYVTGGDFAEASNRDDYKAGIKGSGTVIITGGTFRFDPTQWVAPGYIATKNNGVWTVSAE